MEDGVGPMRYDIGRWGKRETTLMDPWVRDAQVFFVDDLIAEQQDVDVDGPGVIPRSGGPDPAQVRFDPEQRT